MTEVRKITHFHVYCGLGGAAKGFKKGNARVGNLIAEFECLGGIDSDAAAIRDFDRIVGVKGTVRDIFSLEQYLAFHGKAPPPGWREATVADFHAAAQHRRPNVLVITAPCKGFSGLLSEKASKGARYQALNGLAFRGLWLALEAWKGDPPEFILFENVPRIQTRGRHFIDQIIALVRTYGYVAAETTHDCGELGGLAQSRKRFLLVCRHAEKVPPYLYEPPKRPLRGVGEVIGSLPVPGQVRIGADGVPQIVGGPMHRVPSLQWRTWVRLAFVEAGSDWRSLSRLKVDDGFLADYGIVPDAGWQASVLGVQRWEDTAGTIAGRSSPSNGAYSVADPRTDWPAQTHQSKLAVQNWESPSKTVTGSDRVGSGALSVADPRLGVDSDRGAYGVGAWDREAATITSARSPGQGRFAVADPRRHEGRAEYGQYGVKGWEETGQTVIGKAAVGAGRFTVADPRLAGKPRFNNVYRIVRFGDPSPAVAGPGGPGGGLAVADPRATSGREGSGKYRVSGYDECAGAVIAGSTTGQGEFSGADPRPGCLNREDRDVYRSQGHYGVVPWEGSSGAVPAFAKNNNGSWSVADPRAAEGEEAWSLPAAADNLICVIRALDGTWHRPFTTLELAALQSLVDPEEHLELDGLSDSAWRERIGNMVPPDAAEAIAGVIGTTLLLAWVGQSSMLSSADIWVRDVAVALSVDRPELAE